MKMNTQSLIAPLTAFSLLLSQASAISWLNFGTMTDTNNVAFGGITSGNSQTFDLGNSLTLTVSWTGTFGSMATDPNPSVGGGAGWSTSPTSAAKLPSILTAGSPSGLGAISNQTEQGTNTITLTFNTATDITLLSQRENTGASTEKGVITTDAGDWYISYQHDLSSLTGEGSKTLSYDGAQGSNGSFAATTLGTTQVTYTFDNTTKTTTSLDPFLIGLGTPTPEPSSALLLGLGGLALLGRRNK